MRLNSLRHLYIYSMSTANQPTICNCKTAPIAKKNLPFSGNTVNSSNSNAMRYSQIARGQGVNYGSTRFISNEINAFGYYSGGPGGSGAPPRNSF